MEFSASGLRPSEFVAEDSRIRILSSSTTLFPRKRGPGTEDCGRFLGETGRRGFEEDKDGDFIRDAQHPATPLPTKNFGKYSSKGWRFHKPVVTTPKANSFPNYFVWQHSCDAAKLTMQMSGARKAEDIRITKELVVINKLGIHARPAALFVKTANRFDCDIFVEKDGEKVNGKSIMGLMMLAAGPGSKLLIYAEGQDAARAVVEIESLIRRKFDED